MLPTDTKVSELERQVRDLTYTVKHLEGMVDEMSQWQTAHIERLQAEADYDELLASKRALDDYDVADEVELFGARL